MKRGQKGFGTVEGLLILIIVLLVGFIGYYVYHTRNNANSTYNNVVTDTKGTPATSTQSKIDTSAASKLVSDFYNKYYQASGGGNVDSLPDRDQAKALVQQYGTSNLIDTYNSARAFDPVTCSQQVDPMTVTDSKAIGSKVVVSVRDNLAEGAQAFTVDVIESNGLKIDKVNCPINT